MNDSRPSTNTDRHNLCISEPACGLNSSRVAYISCEGSDWYASDEKPCHARTVCQSASGPLKNVRLGAGSVPSGWTDVLWLKIGSIAFPGLVGVLRSYLGTNKSTSGS